MKNSEFQEVFFKINLNRIGLKEDFFGKIVINNNIFDINFSTPYLIKKNKTIKIKEVKKIFNSVDLVVIDKENRKINLDLKEFLLFYTIFLISIKNIYQEVNFFDHFYTSFSLSLSKRVIKFLNQPKFNCEI